MPTHPLAGQPAPIEKLPNIPRIVSAYYTHKPDPETPAQQIAFGTSGHRGQSTAKSFNENHILATTQALCKACGTCVASCPSGAITAHHFTDEQIYAQIEGILR